MSPEDRCFEVPAPLKPRRVRFFEIIRGQHNHKVELDVAWDLIGPPAKGDLLRHGSTEYIVFAIVWVPGSREVLVGVAPMGTEPEHFLEHGAVPEPRPAPTAPPWEGDSDG